MKGIILVALLICVTASGCTQQRRTAPEGTVPSQRTIHDSSAAGQFANWLVTFTDTSPPPHRVDAEEITFLREFFHAADQSAIAARSEFGRDTSIFWITSSNVISMPTGNCWLMVTTANDLPSTVTLYTVPEREDVLTILLQARGLLGTTDAQPVPAVQDEVYGHLFFFPAVQESADAAKHHGPDFMAMRDALRVLPDNPARFTVKRLFARAESLEIEARISGPEADAALRLELRITPAGWRIAQISSTNPPSSRRGS